MSTPAELQERRRIANALEEEGKNLPCHEDGEVYGSAAWLVRGDFSYAEAERLELANERYEITRAERASLPSGGGVDEAIKHAEIFLAMVPAVLGNDDPPKIAHAHAAVVVQDLLRTLTAREGECAALKGALAFMLERFGHLQERSHKSGDDYKAIAQARVALEGKP